MGFPEVPACRPQGQGPHYCLAGCLAMTTHTHTHTFFSSSREKQGNVHLLSGLSTLSNIACAGLSRGSPSECAPRAEKVASGPNARSPPRCGGCCCSFRSANTQEFAGGKGGLPSDSSLSWGNKEACKSSLLNSRNVYRAPTISAVGGGGTEKGWVESGLWAWTGSLFDSLLEGSGYEPGPAHVLRKSELRLSHCLAGRSVPVAGVRGSVCLTSCRGGGWGGAPAGLPSWLSQTVSSTLDRRGCTSSWKDRAGLWTFLQDPSVASGGPAGLSDGGGYYLALSIVFWGWFFFLTNRLFFLEQF